MTGHLEIAHAAPLFGRYTPYKTADQREPIIHRDLCKVIRHCRSTFFYLRSCSEHFKFRTTEIVYSLLPITPAMLASLQILSVLFLATNFVVVADTSFDIEILYSSKREQVLCYSMPLHRLLFYAPIYLAPY
jgi:hypothetical protein